MALMRTSDSYEGPRGAYVVSLVPDVVLDEDFWQGTENEVLRQLAFHDVCMHRGLRVVKRSDEPVYLMPRSDGKTPALSAEDLNRHLGTMLAGRRMGWKLCCVVIHSDEYRLHFYNVRLMVCQSVVLRCGYYDPEAMVDTPADVVMAPPSLLVVEDREGKLVKVTRDEDGSAVIDETPGRDGLSLHTIKATPSGSLEVKEHDFDGNPIRRYCDDEVSLVPQKYEGHRPPYYGDCPYLEDAMASNEAKRAEDARREEEW